MSRCVECGHKECVCDSAFERLALKILTYAVVGMSLFIFGVLAAMFVISFAEPKQQEQSVEAFQPVETYAKEVGHVLRADLFKPGCIRVNRTVISVASGGIAKTGIKDCLNARRTAF